MFQVKCFEFEHEKDLEDAINEFLEKNAHHELVDVKYSSSIAVESVVVDEDGDVVGDENPEVHYSFSAMVVYQKLKY